MRKKVNYFLFCSREYLADPGEARGCSTNTFVINSVTQSVSDPFPPASLRRRHAQTVNDSSSTFIIEIKNFLNPEGHHNFITGSKVVAFLLKGWILPIGAVTSGRVCVAGLFIAKEKELLNLNE